MTFETNLPEFKAFTKIERLAKAQMSITQKIHGTNAQILIEQVFPGTEKDYTDPATGTRYRVTAGSRTRWIFPGDDNYGFAAWVAANRGELVRFFGIGAHFGEWAGPGINSGEGLTEKTFVFFDWWRYGEATLMPPQVKCVPLLHKGELDLLQIERTMKGLKENGSELVPGFMRPEGVVVSFANVRYKVVFEAEETKWRGSDGHKEKVRDLANQPDYSYLLQPIRLEKLLSRDERYRMGYPETLPQIVKAYFEDLAAEGQLPANEDEARAIRKGSSSSVFHFIRATLEST